MRAELMTTRVKREADWLGASNGSGLSGLSGKFTLADLAKTEIASLRCNGLWQIGAWNATRSGIRAIRRNAAGKTPIDNSGIAPL
jgi:hypothetical protein